MKGEGHQMTVDLHGKLLLDLTLPYESLKNQSFLSEQLKNLTPTVIPDLPGELTFFSHAFPWKLLS